MDGGFFFTKHLCVYLNRSMCIFLLYRWNNKNIELRKEWVLLMNDDWTRRSTNGKISVWITYAVGGRSIWAIEKWINRVKNGVEKRFTKRGKSWIKIETIWRREIFGKGCHQRRHESRSSSSSFLSPIYLMKVDSHTFLSPIFIFRSN